jgi:hypothetical protein
MPSYFGVFTSEAIDLGFRQPATEPGIKLSRKLIMKLEIRIALLDLDWGSTYIIIEFREQFGVQEQISSRGKLISDGIKENLGTIVFVLLGCALLRFNSH